MTRLTVLAVLVAAAGVAAPVAAAGEPQIDAQARGTGFNRTLVVRITDSDTGQPVTGATVKAKTEMTSPHFMRLLTRTVPERSPGTYSLPYTFVMPGDWKVDFEVSGPQVETATSELDVPVGVGAQPSGTTILPTRLEADVSSRDWLSMAMLWFHSLAALGWIIGVVAMAIALSTPDLLATGARAKISAAYRNWGAWVHWALVPVIVGTGIYNMVYVTPFKLLWPWDDQLAQIAYGKAYEAILLVKLSLFVVLLVTGTAMLIRVVKSAEPHAKPGQSWYRAVLSGLGAPGAVYLLTIPAILGAAMALRYVHILSHVAEVVNA